MLAKALKTAWVLCCLTVLVVTLARTTSGAVGDIGEFLVHGMLILAFPASLLVSGLLASLVLLQDEFGVPLLDLIASNYVGHSVMWLAFFVSGYLQWFVLLPKLWRAWKQRRADRDTP